MRKAIVSIVGILAGVLAFAQPFQFIPAEDIPFFSAEHPLQYPLAGGIEAPQFVEMELNNDGLTDLIVFDRAGSKAMPFVAYDSPEGIQYRYAPAYEPYFPPLYQLFQTADLNCDGLADLLTMEPLTSAADVMLKAYLRLPGTQTTLAFEERTLHLLNNPDTIVRIHAFDLPAITDINGDGLPDVLYIPQGGTQIQYFENVSQQLGACDSLVFELRDDCWGNASYELNGNFLLHSCGPRTVGCAGSAMLATDYDEDGDKDLLFSGIYGMHVQLLMNGGDTTTADLISQEVDWLLDGEPIMEFPAPYLIDLDLDGQTDLLVATNRLSGVGAGLGQTKIYHFTESEESGGWQFLSDAFLFPDMVDHGFRSSPAVWDANADGLPDLLIGYNIPHAVYGYISAMALYLNEGTASQPSFRLATDNCGNLLSNILKAIHPTFGDLDGDGQDELVIGLADGKMKTFHTINGDNPIFTPMDPDPLAGFQLNGFAKPQILDINADGLPDLACGTRNGTITLLLNDGSVDSPSFAVATDTLGDIVPQGYFQENSPFLLPSANGEFWLYNGQFDGKISLYKGQPGQAFFLQEKNISPIDVGERAAICLHDLNGDQRPELIVGNMRGGIELFETAPLTSQDSPMATPDEVLLFPNPNRGEEVFLKLPFLKEAARLSIFNASGQLLRQYVLQSGRLLHRLNLQGLPTGFYFYQIQAPQFNFCGKMLLKR